MTGHLFGDRYQVGDTLGFGGMSEVHRGRDLRLGRDVAIKVLRADLARDPSFQARFRREAQNAASLNHPAIVAVYDTGETPGETGPIPYIVMEYVDGETLRDLLKREGSLSPRRAMEIVADVCAALDFSHRHGIVHRDIKPANVMLTRAGAVKVMDFGIARAVADGQNTMTATAAVIGTAQYLSPEQARGEAVDARSDVYATGCVLFELLTGSPPFTGDSPVAVAYQHVREDPKAPSAVKPGLPRELDAIVLKALNKNPLNRYQTAAEMRSDLVRALSGQAVRATPVMSDEERTQLLRPGPMRVGAAAGAAASTPPLLAPPRRSMPEDSWAEEEPEKSGKKVWGYVGIGVLCAALLAAGIFFTLRFLSTDGTPDSVLVARVTDMTQEQAIRALQDQGLEPGVVTQVASSNEMLGKITQQNPSANTQVDVGSKVNLEVGAGVAQVPVPDVSGMEATEAKQVLENVGLVLSEQTEASSDADNKKAIRQDPEAPTEVEPGSTVTVVFGSGQERREVPDGLVGKSYDEAAAALTALGLVPNRQDSDSIAPLNQVIGLVGVAAGDNIPVGSPVTLAVSRQNRFIMPNLLQKSPDEAIAQLQGLGWLGSSLSTDGTVATTNRNMVGRILAGGDCGGQRPAVGAEVGQNDIVAICTGVAARNSVPPVVGLTGDQAVAALRSAGFSNISAADAGAPPAPELGGTVRAVSPGASNFADFDATITIEVYQVAAPATSASAGAPGNPPGNGGNGGG